MKDDYCTEELDWNDEDDEYNDNDENESEELFEIASRMTKKNPVLAFLAWECGIR